MTDRNDPVVRYNRPALKTGWALVIAWLLAMVVVGAFTGDIPMLAFGVWLAAVMGSAGGMLFVPRREEGESEAALWATTALRAIIFATALWLIFVGNLVSGELFPEFVDSNPSSYAEFLGSCTPKTLEDYGKLLVWSFLAGYSERLVPIFLASLVGSAGEVGRSVAEASAPAEIAQPPGDEPAEPRQPPAEAGSPGEAGSPPGVE